jgi:hypothetical protein
MLSKNIVHHTVGDIRNGKLNYEPWLLPGETLSSAAIVSSSATLLITNVAILQGRRVTYTRSGGLAGETATITATVNTSKTERSIETFEVLVSTP